MMKVSSIVLNIFVSPLDHIMRHRCKRFCHNHIRVRFLMHQSVYCVCSTYLSLYYDLTQCLVSHKVCVE
jgi:phosphopantetheinyl transferase